MKDVHRERIKYFKPAHVSLADGQVSITETDGAGAGTIAFSVDRPCISISARPSRSQFLWLANEKCADGAFILFDGEDLHLHIVELKGNVGHSDWKRAKSQFDGMFLNIMAFLGVIGVDSVSTVTCHIAFKTENLNPSTTASPILIKRYLGGAPIATSIVDWTNARIGIGWLTDVVVNKHQRDAEGNAKANALIGKTTKDG